MQRHRLIDAYPRSVHVGKDVYRFHAPFDTVLFVLSLLDDDSMLPEHRIALCCRMLFGFRLWSRRRQTAALSAFMDLLNGSGSGKQHEPVMDFDQDAALIRSGFLQQYGIDLDAHRGKMSWFRFMELVGGLTEDTAFGKVCELRSRPIPAPNKYNQEERAKLILAKQRVAIRKKHSEADLMKQFAALADRMIEKAGGGSV